MTKKTTVTQRDIERQIERNDDERRKIRRQLYDLGFPTMSIEEAEKTARRLTMKN